MTTDRFLRIEYRDPDSAEHMPWLLWSDEPASQLIEELRAATDGGRYRARALEADGTVVAELNPAEPRGAVHRVRAFCDAWQRVTNADPATIYSLTQRGVDYWLLTDDLRELIRRAER